MGAKTTILKLKAWNCKNKSSIDVMTTRLVLKRKIKSIGTAKKTATTRFPKPRKLKPNTHAI
jgi:hypothetical protein